MAGADHSREEVQGTTREMHVTYHFSVSLRKGQAVCRHLCGRGLLVDDPRWSTCISVPHPGLTLQFPGAGSHLKVWPGTGVSQSPGLKAWVRWRGATSSTLWMVPLDAPLASQSHQVQNISPECCPPQTPVIRGMAPPGQKSGAHLSLRLPPAPTPQGRVSFSTLQASISSKHPAGWSRCSSDIRPLPAPWTLSRTQLRSHLLGEAPQPSKAEFRSGPPWSAVLAPEGQGPGAGVSQHLTWGGTSRSIY